tara:strand:+ start:2510 stop:2692 length:183 start_codon:yes stop_codon:yes gene_type:complete
VFVLSSNLVVFHYLLQIFKIFEKLTTRTYRRMAVALAYGSETTTELVEKAKEVATKIKVG